MTFTPQNQYSKKDLIACGDGELFGIGNGRLPSDQMLMFDEIESIFDSGGIYAVSYTHLTLPTKASV